MKWNLVEADRYPFQVPLWAFFLRIRSHRGTSMAVLAAGSSQRPFIGHRNPYV